MKLLPAIVRPADLPADLDPDLGYPLGLDEDLEPIFWNPQTDQHLVIFGEEQSGTLDRAAAADRADLPPGTGSTRPGSSSSTPHRRLLDLPYRPDQLIASATNGRDAAGVIGANLDRLQSPAAAAVDEPRGDRPPGLVGVARRHLPDRRQLRTARRQHPVDAR